MCQSLRKEFGKERINLNANRVYHPHFYQIQLIPKELRVDLADEIEYCMKNEFDLLDDEISQLSKEKLKKLSKNLGLLKVQYPERLIADYLLN